MRSLLSLLEGTRRSRLANDCFDRVDNVCISGTAAQIANQCVADFVFTRCAVGFDELGHVHENASAAEAALQGMMIIERFLQRVQLSIDGRTPRSSLSTVRLHRQHEAGLHRFPVDMDRAGPTYALEGACHVGPRQSDYIANKVNEQHPGLALIADRPRR